MERLIEEGLADMQYSLLGNSDDLILLITRIIESKNTRYLKTIPYLIYKYRPNLKIIFTKFENVSFVLDLMNIVNTIFKTTSNDIAIKTKNLRSELDKLLEGKTIVSTLNLDEFRSEFKLQLSNQIKKSESDIFNKRSINVHLAQLFTSKERDILNRINSKKPLSKTESEYFSRKTKKKLNAILNLSNYASTTLSLDLIIDKNLFKIKSDLEVLIGDSFVVDSYFISDTTLVIVSYHSVSHEERTFSLDLSDIDINLRNLINSYPSAEF